MNERAKMPQSVRAAVTVLNIALIVVGLLAMLVLGLGTAGAKNGGTFGLFGRSYHLNQSEQMSPVIEKNDLVAIRKADPTDFQLGDLIAYYQEDAGKDYLLIRRLVSIAGSEYYLEDGEGEQTIVDANETRFLGKVTSRSPKLGTAVQFLQSKDGKKIYLWWTASLLFLLIGVIVLLHVIVKNMGRGDDDEDEDEDYGVEYMEARQTFREAPPAEPEEESEDDEEADVFVDASAFGAEKPDGMPAPVRITEPEEDEDEDDDFFVDIDAFAAEKPEPVSGSAGAPESLTKVMPAAEPSAGAVLTEQEEDDFDLDKIISDIQAKLDSAEGK